MPVAHPKDQSAADLFFNAITNGLQDHAKKIDAQAAYTKPAASVSKDAARESVLDFTRYTFFGFDESWHHRKLAAFMDRFAAGEIPRAMVFMPPRHSKSEFVSRRLPAYIFGKNPKAKIIAASYTHDLAVMMSRDVQRIMESPAYEGLFPETKISGKRTDPLWEVNNGEVYYRAAGVNVGISGMGASYAIIDDPIKDAAEANSHTYRDNLWEWYTSTLYTRLEQPGSVLLTMTRWHEDDLAGRLLKLAKDDPEADQWEVLDLRAIAEEDDPPNRMKGDALWPSRFPIERLKKIAKTLGDWFDAMYQQRPGKVGGTMFKRDWFGILDAMPSGATFQFCRYWDVAGTEGGGDFTVGTLEAKALLADQTTVYIIVDVTRGQWDSGGVDAVIRQTAVMDRQKWGFVRTREEQEPGSSGKAVIASRRKLLSGFDYDGRLSTGEKTLRWGPLASESKGRSVFLLRGDWNYEWLEEMVRVPKAKNDDQADSASGAYNELALGVGGLKKALVSGY